jgi:antitoxin (DNA-binding transcriptional repressor) of toxin-antitoxin stability system
MSAEARELQRQPSQTRINFTRLREQLAEVLNICEYMGKIVVVNRRGRDSAAIVPMSALSRIDQARGKHERRDANTKGAHHG